MTISLQKMLRHMTGHIVGHMVGHMIGYEAKVDIVIGYGYNA
jgi:hypothetical protein